MTNVSIYKGRGLTEHLKVGGYKQKFRVTMSQSPQNVGSRDPGSQRRFCQVKKVSPKNFALCCKFLDYQKKNSSIAIMYHTYKNFLSLFISKPSCIMLTGIFICFLLPNLRIFRDISRSHLIDFVVWITQKWGRSGFLKFGPEEGQHMFWGLEKR